MSRLIKVRVWDEESKVMRNQDEYNNITVDCFFNSNLVLMQYTGINDTNGVGIYEDYIVSVTNGSIKTGVVSYSLINCAYVITDRFGTSMYLGVAVDKGDVEVIGNIHENPELLEDK